MPIFLDRHDMVEQSAAGVAKLHIKDLEIQDQYGVKFLTYWYDAERRTTFCLVDAPTKEMADRVHREAHGHVANEMLAVDLSAVDRMAVELLKAHDAIIRRSLEQHGGSEVKHLGDGIMASFDDGGRHHGVV
jgi:hypothetical protein